MILKLDNLSKQYDGYDILSNLSYSLEGPGVYIVTGESGVGKTTFLRIIAGLDNEYSGSVIGGGMENISFMFQEYRLFPALNAVKNAALASPDNLCEASEHLIRLGFKEADLKKKPRELSGGMKQRVAFVRALLKKSPILLLDEPTKELDQDTASIMLEIINEEAKKRLVIVVTHDDISDKLNGAQIIRLESNK